MFKQLGLIGCGLMGGSFALALKRAGLVGQVVGYSPSPTTLAKARQIGAIDMAADSALLAVAGSDIVLLAVPVAATEATLKAIHQGVTADTLVMDVGSTKRDVADAARRALGERLGSFVPAHPIAGKESAGIDHADAQLYSGCRVVLTPLPETRPEQLSKATDVWSALGCRVTQMSAEEHDAAFAAVSHLPHLLAFAYYASIAQQTAGAQFLALAGPGFRDFTRIAAADPVMWRDVLISNREEILQQSQRFRAQLDAFEQLMQTTEPKALESLIREASASRSSWKMNSSPVGGER
jgi:prephenate dehydrogenase